MTDLNQLLTIFQFPARLNTSLIVNLALVSVAVVLFYVVCKLILNYLQLRKPYVCLEIKPLKTTELNPYSTEQLFALLHGLTRSTSFLYKLFNINKSYSLEIVASKEDGIRYLMRVGEGDADLVKKSLLSYLPSISVNETSDYLSIKHAYKRVTEFKLSNHFSFPIKSHTDLAKHDPIAYLTGSMTKLSDDELIAFQLIVSAVNKKLIPDIKRISHLIYSEKDLLKNINNRSSSSILKTLHYLVFISLQIALLPLGLMIFIATGGNEGPFLNLNTSKPNNKTNNPYQTEIEQLVKNKLDQQLFKSSLRVLVAGDNRSLVSSRERGFVSSLISLSNTSYQSFSVALMPRLKLINRFKYFLYNNRLLLPFSKVILSISEVGDLYHFPFTKTTKTEDLLKEYSKELPAPLSLKKTSDLDTIFAKNTYGGSVTPIGLKQDERRRHIYILGATGTGKSTMLLSMIDQDIKNNKGLAVIDPHGDLIEQILHIIPENRIEDVIYFNPDDISYPMGINLLELTKDLNEEDAIREKEFLAESIISLFHKIYTEKYSGPRMEYILRNTIHTAFTVPDATLFTVYKLLINTKYRKSVVKNITDENLRDFWKYEFAKAGDYQKVKMISPITNKIGRFLFSPTAKRILEQEKSTIDFDQIMNDGKILLCNVSKGRIGEDNSEVFGVVIMAKLQLAALKRARVEMKDRKDFYLYVDEFQNFATPAFAQILSEARKYKLNAILAHQTTSQLEDKSLVNVTLANTGTVICFRTANPEDEKLILPQFRPYIEPGEIASLPSYRFYMRLGALNPEEPFSGITVPLQINESKVLSEKVVEHSRKQYALKYKPSNNIITPVRKDISPKRKITSPGILP